MNTLEGNTSQYTIGAVYTSSNKELMSFVLACVTFQKCSSVIDKVVSEVCGCRVIRICAKIVLLKNLIAANAQKNKKALWSTGCSQIVVADANKACQSIPAAGILAQPAGSLQTEICTQRLRSETTGGRGRAGEGVEEREAGSCSALSLEQTRGCIHPSTGSPDSQAPGEAFSEELGECGGQGGWGDGAPRTLIMEAREGVVFLSRLFNCLDLNGFKLVCLI